MSEGNYKERFRVGQQATLSKTFSETEVANFSALSMDANPIHLDKEYAAGTRFGQRIVQGPMVASLIGGVLGSYLPGPGTIYINQQTKFLSPAFIDEPLEAEVTVTAIREDKPVITLHTLVRKADGQLVIDGEAIVLFMENL